MQVDGYSLDAQKEKLKKYAAYEESVGLYPERLENGRFLKHIHFRFLVYYNGTVIDVLVGKTEVQWSRNQF